MAWGRGNRILVQDSWATHGPQDPSQAPAQRAALLLWRWNLGGVGGASQETKEPGDPVAGLSV